MTLLVGVTNNHGNPNNRKTKTMIIRIFILEIEGFKFFYKT